MQKMNKRQKAVASGVAFVMALVLALTGTFAWQSANQRALNEKVAPANPGGRLHDDFDGDNKDVYVENFTTPGEGVDIFARIRLDEYMEIGKDAGMKDQLDRRAQSVLDGADINDLSTWRTRLPSTNDAIKTRWSWATGGSTVYMPTFNKDQDSLTADVNGTYEGTLAGDDVHYDDYHKYTLNEERTSTASYGEDGSKKETHTAKSTLSAAPVITMDQWEQDGNPTGSFWVWDDDGWFYWANPIEPATATGLLLDGISMNGSLSQRWYYGINVVGQFVTADDMGKENGTGFYDKTKGASPSERAEKLLETVGAKKTDIETIQKEINAIEPGSNITVTIDGNAWYVLAKDNTNHRALLLSKNILQKAEVSNNITGWKGSSLETLLNDTWLPNQAMLSQYAVEVPLTTRNSSGTDDTTNDKVFLLSEADVFGVTDGSAAAAAHYTAGSRLNAPAGVGWNAPYNGASGIWWLRSSLKDTGTGLATVSPMYPGGTYANSNETDPIAPGEGGSSEGSSGGGSSNAGYRPGGSSSGENTGGEGIYDDVETNSYGVRPALWFDLGNSTTPTPTPTPVSDAVVTVTADNAAVKVGNTVHLTASVTRDGQPIDGATVTWTQGQADSDKFTLTTSGNTASLTNKYDAGGTCTVYAMYNDGGKVVSGSCAVTFQPKSELDTIAETINTITPGDNTKTVTIDGVEWYVLDKDTENNRALLMTKYVLDERLPFNDTDMKLPIWRDCTLRQYLNGTWLSAHSKLADYVIETDLYTRIARETQELIHTQDKVFVLSKYDTSNKNTGDQYDSKFGQSVFDDKIYTAGHQLPEIKDNRNYTVFDAWSRGDSPSNRVSWLTRDNTNIYVSESGNGSVVEKLNYGVSGSAPANSACRVRPAVWIRLS